MAKSTTVRYEQQPGDTEDNYPKLCLTVLLVSMLCLIHLFQHSSVLVTAVQQNMIRSGLERIEREGVID